MTLISWKNSDLVEAFNTIEISHMDEHETDDLMAQIIHESHTYMKLDHINIEDVTEIFDKLV